MSAFREWLAKDQPLLAGSSSDAVFPGMVTAMELAWDAALEAAARAQRPMLRDMISRGHAATACRALKVENRLVEGVSK